MILGHLEIAVGTIQKFKFNLNQPKYLKPCKFSVIFIDLFNLFHSKDSSWISEHTTYSPWNIGVSQHWNEACVVGFHHSFFRVLWLPTVPSFITQICPTHPAVQCGLGSQQMPHTFMYVPWVFKFLSQQAWSWLFIWESSLQGPVGLWANHRHLLHHPEGWVVWT